MKNSTKTMNQKIYVTHVELLSHFIKIHGQTNRTTAMQIEFAMATTFDLFKTYPPPLVNMLDVDSVILVHDNHKYYRGRFIGTVSDKAVNVLLIDVGCIIQKELKFIRVLSVCPKASASVSIEPPQASEFILNQCILNNDSVLSKIRDDIISAHIPYNIEHEIGKTKLISLYTNGRNYAESLINAKLASPMTVEQQNRFLTQMQIKSPPPRPVRGQYSGPVDFGQRSIQPTSKQLIANHLGVKANQVPQNVPSYHPKIPPTIDYNANRIATTNPTQTMPNYSDSVYHMPTFISDTLLVNGRHQVYVSHVEDGPYNFCIQLKSSEQKMTQMMDAISKCELRNLSRKATVGMACIARYSEDNNLYRAVIMSIHDQSCQMLYVDYGNSEKVLYNNIYDIPEEFLRNKTFAIRVSLAGLKTISPLPQHIKNYFKKLVNDKELDMLVTPLDGQAFVQYCELTMDGENVLNRLKDRPKFIEATQLSENDFVVIRYVESPKLFYVQKTKNIVAYNDMMDKLFQYCMTASELKQFDTGTACAARFKNDSEFYRAEILNVNGNNAFIRFVDYGIAIKTDTSKLKVISYDFLTMPKQAVQCCLLGFEAIQTLRNSSQEQMDLFAEDSIGERRNFRVKIIGDVNGAQLVNLIDESQMPHLDLSFRMLQLTLPQKSFRQYELKLSNENSAPQLPNVKATSDSLFIDSGISSNSSANWDTSDRHDHKSKTKADAQNHSKDDTQSSGIGSSDASSPTGLENLRMNAKDSKFYKNQHYTHPTYKNPSEGNSRSVASDSSRRLLQSEAEEKIDANTQIPFENIALNSTLEVRICWWISPLEFYICTIQSDVDLDYTMQMKNIHHFYKTKSPATNINIGSFAIVKYSKNNQLHRAKILDHNEKLNRYKAQLIDVGALTIVDPGDIYDMDKRFAKLERQAIHCSLNEVALQVSRLEVESALDKYVGNKTLMSRFIKRKGDVFYVDIEANGVSLRESLLRDELLSVLSEDIQIERLVAQTVMAKFVLINDLSSFQLVICGCETIFEASYKDFKNCTQSLECEFKNFATQKTLPVRIDALSIGKTFVVTPLIELFGEAPLSAICSFPFFSDNFKIFVSHWETCNIAYVQSVDAENLAGLMLDGLYEYYERNGEILEEFIATTLCAVKSADENWYRAEILNETNNKVNIRYLDYGNCELIPKALIKRLESQFLNESALAVEVYLPLKGNNSTDEATLNEISTLTKDLLLDLKVLELYGNNWIVDISNDKTSIMSIIETKKLCKKVTLDELKKRIDADEILNKSTTLALRKPQNNHHKQQIKTSTSAVLSYPVQPIAIRHDSQPVAVSHGIKPNAVNHNIQPVAVSQYIQPVAVSHDIQPIAVSHDIQPIAVSQDIQPTIIQNYHQTIPKTTAYISHIDRPDRFYLQIASKSDELDQLQENIQIVAPSLPPLKDFNADTRCIVRYSVDDQWYRAVIIDSDTKITSILFMDYGNTDTITDNRSIKSMNDEIDQIPAFAIPCSLPLETKNRIEWSDESCQVLRDLVNDVVEFEYVCKGKCNNFVKLYNGDRDIMEELIANGYAIKLDTIKSGENCYVSHVNSISDFYIQMESDTRALEIMSDYLSDYSRFEVMTDIKEGVVCAAKFLDDGFWYRGKIKSHSADHTEVFFCDYGNSSSTNELRLIPTEIANGPTLAKYCSLGKPKDVQYWSEAAERRFLDRTDGGIVFTVDVISPGKQSVVDLIVNENSMVEEIADLCDKYSLSALENTLQSNAVVESETVKAYIVDGSPDRFYIQLESSTSELDRLCLLMESAVEWPKLKDKVFGHLCAALFDGSYYRAKIMSINNEGAEVHFIDYGNESATTDLRILPENLQNIQPLSILCSLESKSQTFSPNFIERFANLSRDNTFEIQFVSKTSSSAVVQLFENGVLFADKPNDTLQSTLVNETVSEQILEPIETSATGKFKAYISERVSPNHFYVQLNNDMEQAMKHASNFPPLDDNDKFAGKLCAAFWEDYFYRAEILSVDDQGTKVHFIDYGNESFSSDLRKLPDDIEKIERSSILCTLKNENEIFSDDFVTKFMELDLDNEYEFDIINQTSQQLHVVRLYVNGELFTDAKAPATNIKTDDIPKNGQIETESDNKSIVNGIIGLTIERAEQQEFANEIVAQMIDHSLSGHTETNNSNINDSGRSSIVDVATEAERINLQHFESVEKMGLGIVPSNL